MSHLDEFINVVQHTGVHCIAVTETWLKPSLSDTLVHLAGYQLVRNDRTGKRGGGVAFYVRDDVKFKIISKSPSEYSSSPEYLFIEVMFNSHCLLLGVVYRPPQVRFLSCIEELLFDLLPMYPESIILGDWNINLLSNSCDVDQFRSLLDACNLHVLPLNPTHHIITPDRQTHSTIDHIIVADKEKVLQHGQFSVTEISKHDLIFVSYSARVMM
jgi:exonuclease III